MAFGSVPILDGLPYQYSVFGADMEVIKLGTLWTKWNRKYGVPQIDTIMTWDSGVYRPVKIKEVSTASKRPILKVKNKYGRNRLINVHGKVLTTKGLKLGCDLNVGDSLLATDMYAGFIGNETIHKVCARLRLHGIEFTRSDLTVATKDVSIVCKPYDTSEVVKLPGILIVGRNNYGEALLEQFSIGGTLEEKITDIQGPLNRFTMAVELEDSPTLVLAQGLVMGGATSDR